MPYKVDIDRAGRRISSIWRGVIDEATCMDYIERVWSDEDVLEYDEFVDFREIKEFLLDADAIRRLVDRSRGVADPAATARSVFVVADPKMFGLSRQYVSMRDLDDVHQREWQVTMDYEEARAWLDQNRDAR